MAITIFDEMIQRTVGIDEKKGIMNLVACRVPHYRQAARLPVDSDVLHIRQLAGIFFRRIPRGLIRDREDVIRWLKAAGDAGDAIAFRRYAIYKAFESSGGHLPFLLKAMEMRDAIASYAIGAGRIAEARRFNDPNAFAAAYSALIRSVTGDCVHGLMSLGSCDIGILYST